MSKVGFIGVGTMGCPMASNILSKGNELKFYDPYIHDENKSKLENLGAKYSTSIKDLLNDRDFNQIMEKISKQLIENNWTYNDLEESNSVAV